MVHLSSQASSRKQWLSEADFMVDFLIGAHAQLRADQLLTLDAGRYRQAFPFLRTLP